MTFAQGFTARALHLAAAILAALLAASALAAGPAVFNHDALAEGVFLFRPVEGATPRTNSLVIEQERGLVVVEAQPAPGSARELLAAIRELSHKPIRFLVVSHPHLEVAGGVSAFEGATIVVASRNGASQLADPAFDFGAELRAGFSGPGEWSEPPRPTIDLVLDGMAVLADPKRPVVLLPLGQTHSSGGILVRLPEQDVTFAGALVFGDLDPFAGDANVGNWLGALNQLLREAPRVIVPLRGIPVETEAVRKQRDALAWLRGQVDEGFIDRLPPEEIHQRVIEQPEIRQRFSPSARFLGILIDRTIEESVAQRRKHGQM